MDTIVAQALDRETLRALLKGAGIGLEIVVLFGLGWVFCLIVLLAAGWPRWEKDQKSPSLATCALLANCLVTFGWAAGTGCVYLDFVIDQIFGAGDGGGGASTGAPIPLADAIASGFLMVWTPVGVWIAISLVYSGVRALGFRVFAIAGRWNR